MGVVGKFGRGLMVPILIANFVVYLILLGLAGWSLDKYIDGRQNHPHLGGNEATTYMLEFGVLGGATGMASLLGGLMHHKAWCSASLATATSTAVVSFAITAIAFGLAWKEIRMGGHRGKRLQTLELFITISTLSQLLYLLVLHAGILINKKYGPDYRGRRQTDVISHQIPSSSPGTSGIGTSTQYIS